MGDSYDSRLRMKLHCGTQVLEENLQSADVEGRYLCLLSE